MHKVRSRFAYTSVLGVLIFSFSSSQAFAEDNKLNPNIPREAMGNGLFNQTGANSCVYCHGVGGVNGNVKIAANLQNPKSWKIYKILGGDAAFKKDPAGFRSKMKEATMHLILKGAIVHNSSFKRPWFDISKAAPYDGQMLGMTGAPSRSWMKKYKEKYGLKPEVANESVYLYIKTLGKQDVL
jgi:hypothetical protein